MLNRAILCSFIVLSCQLAEAKKEDKNFQFDTFGFCLKQNDKPNILKCAGQQMIETLQQFDNIENFTLTNGVVLSRDDGVMGRSNPINFIDQDPNDVRSLLENAGLVMSQRSFHWDISRLYPGLQLRIGPTVNGGLLEFIVDPSKQSDERSHLHEESTARIMTKKFVLPFLLGLKFNLATLLPIILGLIILISKKAAFLSKLAIFISGMFGLGGIYSLGALGGDHAYPHTSYGGYGYKPIYQDAGLHGQFASPYKVLESNTPRDVEPEDHFYEYDKQHLLKDRTSRLYERKLDVKEYRPTSQRNFVWQTSNSN